MSKFIFVGDLHLRGNNPRNRIDDYQEAADMKLREILRGADDLNADAILIPGDVWDRPEVAIGVLLHYAKILNTSPCPIYTTIGNHDIYGYNLSTYERSSLKLLELLVDKLHVLGPSDVEYVNGAYITATPYSGDMDIDGYGYGGPLPEETDDDIPRIHLAHGMLLDHKPPFDRYTLIDDCKTSADLVLVGHDHLGFGVHKRKDGKIFCNPGALMRMSASINEIERPVQVAIITIDDTTWLKFARIDIQLMPLECAKPGDEVLDRSKIDEAKARQYAMDNFSTLIQSHTGQKVIADVNQIVEEIAKQGEYAPEVVKTALEILDRQREIMGASV